MMKSGWLVFYACLILLALAIGSQFIHLPRHCNLTLARTASSNHRMQPGDVNTDDNLEECLAWFAPAPGDFVGRYLSVARTAGSGITMQDTTTRPLIQSSPDEFVELVALDSDKSFDGDPNADVGELADVCGVRDGGPTCVTNLPVAAVVCPTTKCYAMLLVPSTMRDNLFAVEHSQNPQIFDVSNRPGR